MGVVSDMGRTLGGGARAVMREHLARGPQDARAFAFLMIANLLVFVAQWPRLARQSGTTGDPLDRLVAYEMLSWLLLWPLAFFGIAGLTHLASRALGGRGPAWGARLAMFWAWLAAMPLGLLAGLLAGLTGSSVATNLVAAAWLILFLWLWARCQSEVATGGAHAG